jgi:hypothetical protein
MSDTVSCIRDHPGLEVEVIALIPVAAAPYNIFIDPNSL